MTEEEIRQRLTSLPESWRKELEPVINEPFYKELVEKVAEDAKTHVIYPPLDHVFSALELTPLDEVKCVIVGQDPYINENQANGLAFSVTKGEALPPSLRNIYKELYYEYQYPIPKNGDLTPWAKQGVLLLNSTLTVRAHESNSHASYGWSEFTDRIIRIIDSKNMNLVYMLWGRYASGKKELIKSENACIIETAHPSPMAANKGFFCSSCFKRCNEYLKSHGMEEIDFRIRD